MQQVSITSQKSCNSSNWFILIFLIKTSKIYILPSFNPTMEEKKKFAWLTCIEIPINWFFFFLRKILDCHVDGWYMLQNKVWCVLRTCTIQQGGKAWGRWAIHVMSLVEAQKDLAFSFSLCKVAYRLPTADDNWLEWQLGPGSGRQSLIPTAPPPFQSRGLLHFFLFFLYSLSLVLSNSYLFFFFL